MKRQATLKREISIRGIGLHSGEMRFLKLLPAPVNTGIIFVRTDLVGRPKILAQVDSIVNTQLATTIGRGDAQVSTIEHLMAAFAGLGIDNAICEIDGAELPILDGSSLEFYQRIVQAGIEYQSEYSSILKLKRRVEVQIGDKFAVAEPSNHFSISAEIDWKHPLIGKQVYTYQHQGSQFIEIMSSRTFGFFHEVEAMRKMGLARGGSMENAIVLDQEKVLNPTGLRSPDEFVKHKILDAIGDLKLCGYELEARFSFRKAGHAIHAQLMAAILSDRRNYDIVEALPGRVFDIPAQTATAAAY